MKQTECENERRLADEGYKLKLYVVGRVNHHQIMVGRRTPLASSTAVMAHATMDGGHLKTGCSSTHSFAETICS